MFSPKTAPSPPGIITPQVTHTVCRAKRTYHAIWHVDRFSHLVWVPNAMLYNALSREKKTLKTAKLPFPLGISSPEPQPYATCTKNCGSRDSLLDRHTHTHRKTHTETHSSQYSATAPAGEVTSARLQASLMVSKVWLDANWLASEDKHMLGKTLLKHYLYTITLCIGWQWSPHFADKPAGRQMSRQQKILTLMLPKRPHTMGVN